MHSNCNQMAHNSMGWLRAFFFGNPCSFRIRCEQTKLAIRKMFAVPLNTVEHSTNPPKKVVNNSKWSRANTAKPFILFDYYAIPCLSSFRRGSLFVRFSTICAFCSIDFTLGLASTFHCLANWLFIKLCTAFTFPTSIAFSSPSSNLCDVSLSKCLCVQWKAMRNWGVYFHHFDRFMGNFQFTHHSQ